MTTATGRGAQVRLDGEARDRARGAGGDRLLGNLTDKSLLEQTGAVSDGNSADGSSRTGLPPEDELIGVDGAVGVNEATVNAILAPVKTKVDALVAQDATFSAQIGTAPADLPPLQVQVSVLRQQMASLLSGVTTPVATGAIVGSASTVGVPGQFTIAFAGIATVYMALEQNGVQQGTRVAQTAQGSYPLTGTAAGSGYKGVLYTAASGGTKLSETAGFSISSPVVVLAPVNTTAPSIAGTASVGSVLTGSAGVWTGSPALTYQWKRGGVAITGATMAAYTLVTADASQVITLEVRATNSASLGGVVATSAAVTVAALGNTGTTTGPSPIGDSISDAKGIYGYARARTAFAGAVGTWQRASDLATRGVMGSADGKISTADAAWLSGTTAVWVSVADQTGGGATLTGATGHEPKVIVLSGGLVSIGGRGDQWARTNGLPFVAGSGIGSLVTVTMLANISSTNTGARRILSAVSAGSSSDGENTDSVQIFNRESDGSSYLYRDYGYAAFIGHAVTEDVMHVRQMVGGADYRLYVDGAKVGQGGTPYASANPANLFLFTGQGGDADPAAGGHAIGDVCLIVVTNSIDETARLATATYAASLGGVTLAVGGSDVVVTPPTPTPDPDPVPAPTGDNDGGIATPSSGVGSIAVAAYDPAAWAKRIPPASAPANSIVAPRVIDNASTSYLTGINLNNGSGAALASRYVTRGEVFAKGKLLAADNIEVRYGGQAYPAQKNVVSTWPDGSAFHIAYTFLAPAMANGSSVQAEIWKASSPPAGSALGFSGLAAKGIAVSLTVNGTGFTKAPHTAYADAVTAGTVQAIYSGPFMSLVQVPAVTINRTRAYYKIWAWPGGEFTVEFVAQNYLQKVTSNTADTASHNATITQGGATVLSTGALTVSQGQGWRKVLHTGDSAATNALVQPPALNVQVDVGRWMQVGVIPFLRLNEGVATVNDGNTVHMFAQAAGLFGDGNYMKPLGSNGVTQYMKNTGDRNDIGMLNNWAATWLASGDDRLRRVMMAWGEAGAAVPWNRWDAQYDRHLSVKYNPGIWFGGGNENPAGTVFTPEGANGWTIDLGHQPSLSWVPWLTTADPYFAEHLAHEGHQGMTSLWNARRRLGGTGSKDWLVVLGEQPRAAGWCMRDIGRCAVALPDGHPDKAFFVGVRDMNLNLLLKKAPLWQAVQGELYGWFAENQGYNATQEHKMWMQGKIMNALAEMGKLGSNLALRVFNWASNVWVGTEKNGSVTYECLTRYAWDLPPTTDEILKAGSAPTITTWAQLPAKLRTDTAGNFGIISRHVFADMSVLLNSSGDRTISRAAWAKFAADNRPFCNYHPMAVDGKEYVEPPAAI